AAWRLTMLRVDIEKQLGDFSLQAAFTSDGRVIGLSGASGAGKTTLINIIAGLVPPDRGVVAIDGDRLDDTQAGIRVPAHLRRIGYVCQEALLVPHLSAMQGLDYARRMNRLTREEAAEERVIAMLDIGHLRERRNGKLSGGEPQGVAL